MTQAEARVAGLAEVIPRKMLLDAAEVQRALGVGERHYYELIRQGYLKPVRVPGFTRKSKIPRDQVMELAATLV